MSEEYQPVENYYQGIFITETILGNPNGSFVNNEPRNINGRVFTTDKCIKYNIRNYLHQTHEEINNRQPEKFVFFYPRLVEGADEHENKYMTKTEVFKEYFESDFEDLLDKSIDARMFGGTFSFKGGLEKSVYGPIQLSYGLDQLGSDIINLRVGTPFASDSGKQKTTGEERVVDHAVITYDITVNPNNSPGLLRESDLDLFKEAMIQGTNLRKSTSKKTDAKALILVKFKDGKTLNVGGLKDLVDVKSAKTTDPNNTDNTDLVLDLTKAKDKLDDFKEYIEEIQVITGNATKVENFYSDTDDGVKVIEKGFKDL